MSKVQEYDRKYERQYSKKYPAVIRAHNKVWTEIFGGRLANLREKHVTCVDCGETASHYDHRDYLKPLEVEPVCPSCNKLRGPGLNKEAA